ncbi:MAG: hypothetical protein COV72_07625 [Candidatus Omnitrophica bacterium CG11_big_fil_rev_8_21_14_0_20_42_13]|uniref:RNA polymerase subunit sigma-24 n=1 Tax=Candidatus Ghiorseimicrobium undicola TaxID=1974746 RepID=A0A2H0LYM8_9BACT|nr:MAG: hypothetical protein COV72_07625 [Candidatus Omnitrophica bacterium CG11_big_fil_rev_8_21_14_0_20_42_13]
MQDLTDKELMLKYQQGDTAVMNELLRRYKNPVYHFVLRLSQDAAFAQDIAQEVFVRIHTHRAYYKPCGKFSTWLFSIAHNLCISHLRKKKWHVLWPRSKEDPDKLVEFESSELSPKDVAENNDFSAVLKRCIQGLPFLQKEALILREYQNLDYGEISKILKKSLGAVKTLIHRARLNLKQKLLPHFKEIAGGYDE